MIKLDNYVLKSYFTVFVQFTNYIHKDKNIKEIVDKELIEYPESVQAAWDSLRFWGQVWNSFNTTLGWTIFIISIVFVVCTIYFDQLNKLRFWSLPIIPSSPFIAKFLYYRNKILHMTKNFETHYKSIQEDLESAKFDGEDPEEKKLKKRSNLLKQKCG